MPGPWWEVWDLLAPPAPRYLYLGDRMTAAWLVGQLCDPVLDARGKTLVGGSKTLVRFRTGPAAGDIVIVLRRRLRRVDRIPPT